MLNTVEFEVGFLGNSSENFLKFKGVKHPSMPFVYGVFLLIVEKVCLFFSTQGRQGGIKKVGN